jgi:uncharacterized protein (TIGR02246 family)
VSDEEAIRGLWDTMAEGWSRGDAKTFAGVFTEQADFVNVRGQEQVGRAQVEAGHARLFASVYQGTLMKPDVRLVRPIADGVCLVHVTSIVTPPGVTTHAQAVVTRQDGEWSISAFHNMIPQH